MPPSNSAEYYRKRRETIGQFSVPLSREKLNALTEKLKKQNKTKTQWLNEKVDEELSKKKIATTPHDQAQTLLLLSDRKTPI